MKKRLKLKGWVKVVLGGIVIISAIISVSNLMKDIKKNQKIEEYNTMTAYISCLQDNFTQRDYCSRQVSQTSYMILDQKLEKYGYKYVQKGYDLYLVEISK